MEARGLPDVLVTSPQRAMKELGAYAGRQASAVYLGQDAAVYEALGQACPAGLHLAESGALLGKWFERAREELLNLDNCLQDPQNDELWQASDLAERNPHNLELIYLCCAFLACRELMRRKSKQLILITGNPALGAMLCREAAHWGLSARFSQESEILSRWPCLVFAWRKLGFFFKGLAARFEFLKTLGRQKARLEQAGLASPHGAYGLMLTLWADSQTFPEGKPFERDLYYGWLPQELKLRGLRTLYLANPIFWVNDFSLIVENLKSGQEDVIFPQQCVSMFRACLDSLRTLCWRPGLRTPFVLQGCDLTPLFLDALAEERSKTRQNFALQYLQVARRLRESEVDVKSLIHLYENQPWEKMLRLGFRRFAPHTRLQAYQHMPFSKNYLSFMPSRRDVDAGNLPDRLITCGQAWLECFKTAHFPELNLTCGPALRLEHIFNSNPQAPEPLAKQGLDVLVVGGLDYLELRDILRFKIAGLGSEVPGLRVLVKFHPNMSGSLTEALRREIDPRCAAETREAISALLPRLDAVLYTGSVAGLEALNRGRLPLYLKSELWLDLDKLDWFPELGRAVRGRREIVEALRELLSESPQAKMKRWRSGQAQAAWLFSRPNRESLEVFLRT